MPSKQLVFSLIITEQDHGRTTRMLESAYINAAWTFWQRDEESDRSGVRSVIEGQWHCCSSNLVLELWEVRENMAAHETEPEPACVSMCLFSSDDHILILNMMTFSYLSDRWWMFVATKTGRSGWKSHIFLYERFMYISRVCTKP